MTTQNEQTLPNTTPTGKKPRKERQFFTMEDWKDEVVARKHIKNSFEDIRQRLKDEGTKTRFKKVRHEDGIQSYAIFYEGANGGYSDGDYLAIHFDPARKFSDGRRRPKKKDGEDGKKHKGKSGKFARKMPRQRD
jgi:quinol monooxygenase YgiN